MILLLAGVAAIAGAIMLCASALTRKEKRATGIAEGLAEIETVYAAREPRPESRTDPLADSSILRYTRGLAARLSPGGSMDRLQRRLDIAGNPGVWSPERVMSFKGLGLLVLGTVTAALGLPDGPTIAILFALLGAAGGFFLPDLLLYNAGLRRQDEFQRSLPDILDLLVVSVEAGLGFDAALSRVARNVTGPLSGEFTRLIQEIQIGKSREEALNAMADRTSVEELKTFVGALVQASELGLPIGNVLRGQATEMRLKRRQLAEEKAQKVGVKITLPVLGCILPALFVVVLGPGILGLVNSGLFSIK